MPQLPGKNIFIKKFSIKRKKSCNNTDKNKFKR